MPEEDPAKRKKKDPPPWVSDLIITGLGFAKTVNQAARVGVKAVGITVGLIGGIAGLLSGRGFSARSFSSPVVGSDPVEEGTVEPTEESWEAVDEGVLEEEEEAIDEDVEPPDWNPREELLDVDYDDAVEGDEIEPPDINPREALLEVDYDDDVVDDDTEEALEEEAVEDEVTEEEPVEEESEELGVDDAVADVDDVEEES